MAFAELKNFGHEGSSSRLSGEQESALSDWVDTHCPRSIREIAAFLKRTFGQGYSRSGLIALLHRLGFDYRKPEACQGDCISKQGQEPGEVGFVPTGSLELAPE